MTEVKGEVSNEVEGSNETENYKKIKPEGEVNKGECDSFWKSAMKENIVPSEKNENKAECDSFWESGMKENDSSSEKNEDIEESTQDEISVSETDSKDKEESDNEIKEEGFAKCVEKIEAAPWKNDHVYAILLEGVHESIVGIIAGRVKEKYSRPVFVFTKTDEGTLKGSGRSIPAYHMMEELLKIKSLLLKFGGHKMAAGLTIPGDGLAAFRAALNENQRLTEDDLTPRIEIDANVRFRFVNEELIREINLLEPFGMGNAHPLLAIDRAEILGLTVRGRARQILTMLLEDGEHRKISGIRFRPPEEFIEFLRESQGEEKLSLFREKRLRSLPASLAFYPSLNEYRGEKNIQIVIEHYCIPGENDI